MQDYVMEHVTLDMKESDLFAGEPVQMVMKNVELYV
jgi:hypothetical protein